MGKRLASALALVLGVAVLAGPAVAGNGNGNGKSEAGGSTAAATSPGNSANAPGQLKKDDGASSQAAPLTVAVVSASSSSVSSQGVKPASGTAHDTHAAASSTKTKLYGNGRTAGQIAIQNGAPASTVLHGPGNSQPHKAALCPRGHEVDVHAFKSRRHSRGCGSASRPPGSVSDGTGKGSDPGQVPGTSSRPADQSGAQSSATQSKPQRSSKVTGRESAGVLAATQRAARASLPFTGFPLWIGVVLGVVLLVLGLTLSMLAGRDSEREVGP